MFLHSHTIKTALFKFTLPSNLNLLREILYLALTGKRPSPILTKGWVHSTFTDVYNWAASRTKPKTPWISNKNAR